MVGPWTQILSVNWRPTLAFYENRARMLRALERKGVLREFAVEEHRIGARLTDPVFQMAILQDRLEVNLVGPGADFTSVRPSVELATDLLGELSPRHWQARFQFVVELSVDFSVAVASGADSVVPSLPPDLHPTDWAVLIDLRAPEGLRGQAEYGIIRDAEAQQRLAGLAGRMGPTARSSEPPFSGKLPSVALFVDCRWDGDLSDQSVAEVWDRWETARDLSIKTADRLHEVLHETNGS